MSPYIRPATASDDPAITSIYAAEVLEHAASYEYSPPDEVEMQRRRVAIQMQGFPYVVAELAGAIAGFAYASTYRARIGYRWTVEDSVYVAASARGAGVGRALLAHIIQACEFSGYRQMVAVIGDAGNVASVRLHQQLGFRTVGVFTGLGRKHGRWLDNLQMQRALGAGASQVPRDDNE